MGPWENNTSADGKEASQKLTVPGVGGPTEARFEFGVKKIRF